jgi:hypothetical protein
VNQLYRMHDSDDERRAKEGARPIARAEAAAWQEQGYGIFVSVNEFEGPRRKECLRKIRAWAIDIDGADKREQHRRLLSSPLVPSMIVETKSGFHAWWIARDAKPEHWNAIVLERLVPFFGSDKNARDLCRILRMPGYLHLKDPAHPFKCRVAWRHEVSYSERQIARAFAWVPDKASQKAAHDEARRAAEAEIRARAKQNAIAAGLAPTETLWEAIYALDCEEGLRRLSGHAIVNGEQYTFRRTGRGRLNIFVDGKGSPCFIDENKRIGSPSGGGPTLIQWIRWFGRNYRDAIDALKQVFPQLDEIDRAAREQTRRAS